MRIVVGFIAAALLLIEAGGTAKPVFQNVVVPTASTTTSRIDFDTQVKPILKSKCMPCHFEGGQMYDRLPFDRPATIRKLGTRLFTRIKEENDRRMIEDFLGQSP
ncbi:MAG TPA: hypothetical protein VLA93_22420 [Pyrinomonadaceae bacterium]|nr:hypothetical protein [Pyrinomonadaceae bacterium]